MAAFYDRAYGSAYWREFSTANYGYAPVDEAVARVAPNEPHQIQLYAEALKALRTAAPDVAPQTLLEICCGRGGGLAHVRRALAPLHAIGLDRSLPALRHARARDPVAIYLQADGAHLPFGSGSVDVIFNIEAIIFSSGPLSSRKCPVYWRRVAIS